MDLYKISVKEGVRIMQSGEESVTIQTPAWSFPVSPLSGGGVAALLDLNDRWLSEDEMLDNLTEKDGGAQHLPQFLYFLKSFSKSGLFKYRTGIDDFAVELVPVSSSFVLTPYEIDPQAKYSLSEYCYFRKKDNILLLESPLAHARLEISGWKAFAVCALLSAPCSCPEIGEKFPGLPMTHIIHLLVFLKNIHALKDDSGASETPETTDVVLKHWEFHDLLFHTRSRFGRHENPFGGTYRFKDIIPPLPAISPRVYERTIALFKPGMESLLDNDMPLSKAIEGRKSVRVYSDRPLSLAQIGEFLYRTSRIRGTGKTSVEEVCSKPYPSGGSLYELEVYLVVKQCEALEAGLYHYSASEHALQWISGTNELTESILKSAIMASKAGSQPQVLLVITSRFRRLTWKYQTVAYALMLKHVGALYQTMYLVATAMRLAPCALGGGNSDKFCQAAGLDYYEETSIGEFLLGRAPE
jgi:oxazoline/thiazoline dehydrogenase